MSVWDDLSSVGERLTLRAQVERLTRERDALSGWQCRSCGARFGHHLGPHAASALDGVTRCSKCVEVECLTRERDDARATVARWRTLIENAQAAMGAAGYNEAKHTPASAITGLTRERDTLNAARERITNDLQQTINRLRRERDDAQADCAQFCGDHERLTKERDTLKALVRRLLDYRWRARSGYAFCNACGGRASEDEGRVTNVECSASCPYAQAAALTEDDAHGG